MTYLEAVDLLHHIEEKYDVMSIRVNGLSVWPLLRIRLLDKISGDDAIRKSTGFTAIKEVLETLFYYNPLKYFHNYKVWVFSHNGSRNLIGDKRIERTTGCVIDAEPRTLFIEKPSFNQIKYPRRSIPEKQIVSESWLLMFVHILAKIYPIKKIKIENEDCLKKLLTVHNIRFNYHDAICLLIAQKKVFDGLLSITHKPQSVIIECTYTIMGYVWSLHMHGIKVIEMQHGVLNKHHYAYNSKYHSDMLYPDEMWVWGDEEYKYMTSEECHFCTSVQKVGMYFLDYAKKHFTTDPFFEYRKKGMTICVIAGQTGYEDKMAKYTESIAGDNPGCMFIYVPRRVDAKLSFKSENILFKPGINIYEYMLWCDIHVTISSTTCLECQYYKKPTIFYNYDNRAAVYYGEVLKEENGVVYTNDARDFKSAMARIKTITIEYREIFTDNTVKKMKDILKK